MGHIAAALSMVSRLYFLSKLRMSSPIYEYARQPPVGVALAAVLLVEGDDHFKDLAQQGEGEFIVENGQPARRLILLDPQRLELTHREAVSPPISFVLPIIHPPLYPGGEVLFSADISDPCKERVVHY